MPARLPDCNFWSRTILSTGEHGAAARSKYAQQAEAILDHRDQDLRPLQQPRPTERGRGSGGRQPAEARRLSLRLPCLRGGYYRTAGGRAVAQAGPAGDALLACRHAGLSLVPLRADLRGGRGGSGLPRHLDHRGRLQLDQPGNHADGHRRHPYPDRLFDERYDRGLRPHP